MNKFNNKITIITGGASGIGQALSEELGKRGSIIIVADINQEQAQDVAEKINKHGGKAKPYLLDVTNSLNVEKMIQDTVNKFGRIDYIFNNAGISISGEIKNMDLKQWKQILDVNLMGVIYGSTIAYEVMRKQEFGHIINTASIAGLSPIPMATAYTATKHAVVGLSTAMRAEAADLGVKVSVVCPGAVRTNMFKNYIDVKNIKAKNNNPNLSSRFFMDPNKCARIILRGVARNKGIITISALTKILWWLYRINPQICIFLTRKVFNNVRSSEKKVNTI